MPTPVSQLFYMALRLAGVTKVANVTPSPDQLADCLVQANLMIDQAQVKRPMIYSMRLTQYVLGTAKKYTLGPGGTLVSTTGSSIRPVEIERANLILSTTGTPVHLGIFNGSYQDFANLAVQDVPGAQPQFLYCDYAYPVANVYLVPQDRGGDTLEIYDWQQIQSFATTSDTVQLPPGYQDWFVNNLAVRLASVFKEQGASVTDDVRIEARKSAQAIQSRNGKSPRATSDAPGYGHGRRGDFDYFSGTIK
jgi:hypothetical protein